MDKYTNQYIMHRWAKGFGLDTFALSHATASRHLQVADRSGDAIWTASTRFANQLFWPMLLVCVDLGRCLGFGHNDQMHAHLG